MPQYFVVLLIAAPQNTTINNAKKVERDRHRNAWLLRHRDLFEPLLPSNNSKSFFTNLDSDVHQKSTYVPQRELGQPKSINSSVGQMKDYQVCAT